MPAVDPVCARAGSPASATAAVSAMARDAGLMGRALLGVLATIIWDKYRSPGAGNQGYGSNRVRSTEGRRIAKGEAAGHETR
jgi:hypothetical protein